jgi:hypothetical protein
MTDVSNDDINRDDSIEQTHAYTRYPNHFLNRFVNKFN